jgi:ketosteroid isomerase-like protein
MRKSKATPVGSAAVAEAWVEQTPLFGGDAVEITYASISTFRNGNLVRLDNYSDKAAALAAIGLDTPNVQSS